MIIELGEITAHVTLKDIKNIHLSVYPPTGQVRVSAPYRMKPETIRVYVVSRLDWIKKQRSKFQRQLREPQREYITGESHFFLGKRYLLKVTESTSPSTVILRHKQIEVVVKPGASSERKRAMLEQFYRVRLRSLALPYVEKWAQHLEISAPDFQIKKMRTKWGSCNDQAGRIWINLELAKKPIECIEYVIVHELVHRLERTHNARFIAYMNQSLPSWPFLKDELNRLPISHLDWSY